MVFLSIILSSATGCVFPTRLAEENPFRADIVGFIEPGATTRVEVEDALGTPFYEFSDGRWWAYCADRGTADWLWVILSPDGAGGGTFSGENKQYSLVIRFRDNDIVNKVVVVKDKDGCTRDGTICHKCGYLEVIQDGKKTILIGTLGQQT